MNELTLENKGGGLAPAEGPGPRFRLLPDYKAGLQSRLDEFIAWYGQEPRPGFTKATVAAWRVVMEAPRPQLRVDQRADHSNAEAGG
jgi:hypothetical protein